MSGESDYMKYTRMFEWDHESSAKKPYDRYMKKCGYRSRIRDGEMRKFQKFVLKWVMRAVVHDDQPRPRQERYRPDKVQNARLVYERLYTPKSHYRVRNLWTEIYKKYVGSRVRTRAKFIARFATSKVLGLDILAFFKYKAFPTLECEEYRRMALLDMVNAPKSVLKEHWIRLYRKVKEEFRAKRRKLPQTVNQYRQDLRSFAQYGYFISPMPGVSPIQ